jgi:TonB family protein
MRLGRRVIFLILMPAFATGAWAGDRSAAVALALASAYKNKVLMMGAFYSGSTLHFSSDGKPVKDGEPGPWTLDAFVRVEDVEFKGNRLVISCHRVEYLYSEKERGLISGLGPKVKIEIDSDAATASLSSLMQAIDSIFPPGSVNLADHVPDYWKSYLLNEKKPAGDSKVAAEFHHPGEGADSPLQVNPKNGVTPPIPIYKPEPPYTLEARRVHLSGTAVFLVVVGPDGRVKYVSVIRPVGLGLDDAGAETIRTWRFKPAEQNGTPASVIVSVEVMFQL